MTPRPGADRPARRAGPLRALDAHAGARRILVAEDDGPFRALIVSFLEEDGYEVLQARDGAELLEQLAHAAVACELRRPLDLVITDLNMPGMSGLDALSYLRAGPWASTPVIVMTAFGDDVLHAAAERLGAAAALDKPFTPDQLRRRVRLLLG